MAELTQIIEKTKELGQLLKDSSQVKAFAAARLAYEENSEVRNLLGEFNIHKMSMASLSKTDNPDEEKISEHEDKLREIYDKLMETKEMIDFQQKSQAVEKLIGEINNIINFYVSGETPQGCGGSCDSCGGCSAK